MAIQVKNPFIGAISISLSTSRSSPSKCTVIGGSGAIGVPFAGRAVGSGVEIGVGKNFTITEYLDNSIYLDQNNIILFRRGMPSRPINVTKSIRVPRLSVSGGTGGASVSFYDELRDIAVERRAGSGNGILGSEGWADNPCAGSAVRYAANQATNMIGAPSVGYFLVSYEGQYRSVLSSIYGDAGYSFWWNFTSAGIALIQGSPTGGAKGLPRTGCNIISSAYGETKEGTRSHTSFTYQNGLSEQIRSSSFSRRSFHNFTVSPINGVLWPSDEELNNQFTGGAWYKYQALLGNRSLAEFGLYVVGSLSLPSPSSKEWRQSVGWNDDIGPISNWNNILNIPKQRVSLLTNQTIPTNWNFTDGAIMLVKAHSPFTNRVTQTEFYYPHRSVSYQGRLGAGPVGQAGAAPANDFSTSTSATMSIVDFSYQTQPHASARGRNPCQQDPEYLTGWSRTGHWRGVTFWSPDDAEEGISDNSNYWFGLACQEAIADCVQPLSTKAWIALEELNNPKMDKEKPPSGTLSYLVKWGYQVVWVKRPNDNININWSRGWVNCNDLAEVSGYKSPNDLANDPISRRPTIYFKGVCSSPIERIQEQDQEALQDPLIDAKNVEPGLRHAIANGCVITCNGYTKRFVAPTRAPYIVTGELSVNYDIRAKTNAGKIGAGNAFLQAGSLSSTGGSLAHTVSVTDVTPPDDGSPINVPSSHGGGSIGWAKYTAIDFCCPINSFLETLSTTLSSEGFTATYSYRDISPITPILQRFAHPKINNAGSVTI
jgi:hypothetical protein